MDNIEFYSQIDSYIENGKKCFHDHQVDLLNILRDMHNVCEVNHIPYQLACGTLLGAIRDNCLLPWDYDVDVYMFSKDRERIIELFNKEFKNKYSVDCIENNKNYESYKIRIGKLNVNTKHVHIDIFLLVPIYDNAFLGNLYKWIILRCVGARMFQTGNMKFDLLNNSKDKVSWLIRKVLYGLISLEAVDKVYYSSINRLKDIRSKYYISADIWANSPHHLQRSLIDRTELKDFSFGVFRVPIEYDTVLHSLYGEYKVYPSISRQITEWIRGVDWIS